MILFSKITRVSSVQSVQPGTDRFSPVPPSARWCHFTWTKKPHHKALLDTNSIQNHNPFSTENVAHKNCRSSPKINHYVRIIGYHHHKLLYYCTQWTTYSISHLLCTVTTWWLDSDSEVTFADCQQNSDRAASGSGVTMLPVFSNGDYTVTVPSPCSHCAA